MGILAEQGEAVNFKQIPHYHSCVIDEMINEYSFFRLLFESSDIILVFREIIFEREV